MERVGDVSKLVGGRLEIGDGGFDVFRIRGVDFAIGDSGPRHTGNCVPILITNRQQVTQSLFVCCARL